MITFARKSAGSHGLTCAGERFERAAQHRVAPCRLPRQRGQARQQHEHHHDQHAPREAENAAQQPVFQRRDRRFSPASRRACASRLMASSTARNTPAKAASRRSPLVRDLRREPAGDDPPASRLAATNPTTQASERQHFAHQAAHHAQQHRESDDGEHGVVEDGHLAHDVAAKPERLQLIARLLRRCARRR